MSGADATASAGETAVPQPPGLFSSVPGCSEGTFLLVDDPPAAGVRDSFASIVDDPFFLRFETPDAPSVLTPTPTPTPTTATGAGYRDDEQQPWIPPRKESLSDINPTPWVGNPPPVSTLCPPRWGRGANAASLRLRRARGG